MHRHGYKGRKFNRERDQRGALIKSLAEALIIHETIETTLAKAKEIVPYMEKLITKAKKGDLHNRRLILSSLQTVKSTHKLVDEIAPKLTGRSSGHLSVQRTVSRRGDNAQLARVKFVDDLKEAPIAKPAVQAKSSKPKAASKPVSKPATKKTPAKKPVAKAAKETK